MFLMPSGHNTQPWKFRIADNDAHTKKKKKKKKRVLL